MKKIVSILFAAALVASFASCTKCVTCTYEGLTDFEICNDVYEGDAYDLAIESSEAAGWKCE